MSLSLPGTQGPTVEVKWVDNHKPNFRVNTRLQSSIYTQVLVELACTCPSLVLMVPAVSLFLPVAPFPRHAIFVDSLPIFAPFHPFYMYISIPPPLLPSPPQDPTLQGFFSLCEQMERRSGPLDTHLQSALEVRGHCRMHLTPPPPL